MGNMNARVVPDQFWADDRQANERIVGSYVLYDGHPVYISEVRSGAEYDDGVARVFYRQVPTKMSANKSAKMSDPKFGKFRTLPLVGWFNYDSPYYTGAVYLNRTSKRTRTHGISTNNTSIMRFYDGSLTSDRERNCSHYINSETYDEANFGGGYPDLETILLNIREESSMALNQKFCVYRCKDGIRWLYRKKDRIGFFTGADTLSLFPRFGFYKEEIMDEEGFTINKIKEF